MFCLFGGVNVRVRDGMRTISKTRLHLRRRRQSRGADVRSERTTVDRRGALLFGGVDIRVKKTPKQRLHDFADSLRTMFDAEPPRA